MDDWDDYIDANTSFKDMKSLFKFVRVSSGWILLPNLSSYGINSKAIQQSYDTISSTALHSAENSPPLNDPELMVLIAPSVFMQSVTMSCVGRAYDRYIK